MAKMMNICLIIFSLFFIDKIAATGKMVVYWGQNSAGSFTTEASLQEPALRTYCQDDTYDIIVIGFVYLFPTAPGSTYPGINLANHCSATFDNEPYLLTCPDVAADIAYCQSQGKIIMQSFGGAVGSYQFTSDSEAEAFATTVWNMFLGGNSSMRPYGSTIVDGVDLDIEGAYPTGYAAFVTTLRTYFAGASKTYYISAAPQCPYPDGYLGPGTGEAFTDAWFDFIWVQFYNNYCGNNVFGTSSFNYGTWANWAQTISVNPNVQVFVGAGAYSTYVGSGYVDAPTLENILGSVSQQYPSVFGGVMLWDASAIAFNGDFNTVIADYVHGISSGSAPSASTTGVQIPATTGAQLPATTGAKSANPSTTGAKTHSSTTGAKSVPSTTGSKSSGSKSTTGKTKSTGQTKLTTGSPQGGSTTAYQQGGSGSITGTSTSSSSSSSTGTNFNTACTTGQMACETSETYRTCNFGVWGPSQSCQVGLTCTPAGEYIYCE